MATRTKKPSKETTKPKQDTQSIPDKDKYTAGGPRGKSNTDRARRQADDKNPSVPETAKGDHVAKGKWKPEDEPPYARTYDAPLDEDGAYDA
jgi:hypothetical protein